ncbi:MAG: polysaccharide biosynthesis tyrosine autokinase [Candidatus Scalindua sp.]|nr:polysaccharide biosynthesis tyrosine autokinase [Candidatus Scalindua sp.]
MNIDSIDEPKKIDIRTYLSTVMRRKWIIIAFLIVAVTYSAYKEVKKIPIYTTLAQVIITQKKLSGLLQRGQGISIEGTNSSFFVTNERVLRSRSLATKVLSAMDYKNSREYTQPRKAKLFSLKGFSRGNSSQKPKKIVSAKKAQESGGSIKYEVNDALINNYLSKLSIQNIEDSGIVLIGFTGTHPESLAKMANMHATKFIDTKLELRFAASQDAIKWLQEHIVDKKMSLDAAEEALLAYAQKHKILDSGESSGVVEQKLEVLKSNLSETRKKRIKMKLLYDLTMQYTKDPSLTRLIPEIMNVDIIKELEAQYSKLQTNKSEISKKYGKKHPDFIKIDLQLKLLRNKIEREKSSLIPKIKSDYKALLVEEEAFKKAYNDYVPEVFELNKRKGVYRKLLREAESERVYYDLIIKRMKETNLAEDLKTSNVSILDPALVPRRPIGPTRNSQIMKGAIFGLALGIGLAFFLDYLDNTVKSTEDVENYLKATLLGLVEKARPAKENVNINTELMAHDAPKAVFTEAIRNIRTGIMLSTTDSPHKVLLVTSTRQGEGKSFIAANLAITFAQTGKKTLLIDTDFRRPRQHKVFETDLKPGLSNHFIGEIDLESIIRPTVVPNLNLVTCGLIPPNPSELLGSHNMEKFIDTVRNRFDMVIFDTPPAMTVTDSIVLSRFIDGVVFVIKSGQTPKELTKRALLQFKKSNSEVLGIILNLVDISKGSYYSYYYSHYYKYGYGYGVESPKEKRKRKKREKKEAKA